MLYWERVLISVLLSSDPKFPREISSCLQEILGEEILLENFLVRLNLMGLEIQNS